VQLPTYSGELITETDAHKLIGCARENVWPWIQEGKLWAINIPYDLEARPCYRISKASALEMQKACRKGTVSRQRR